MAYGVHTYPRRSGCQRGDNGSVRQQHPDTLSSAHLSSTDHPGAEQKSPFAPISTSERGLPDQYFYPSAKAPSRVIALQVFNGRMPGQYMMHPFRPTTLVGILSKGIQALEAWRNNTLRIERKNTCHEGRRGRGGFQSIPLCSWTYRSAFKAY